MAPDPILEGLLVPGNNNTDLEQNLQPDHPEALNGRGLGKRAKHLLLFSTVCCIGLVCFALSTSVVLDDIALPTSSGKPELKRVTHAPSAAGYGNGTLLGAVASYLHRTSFHFQPEKNWMNGMLIDVLRKFIPASYLYMYIYILVSNSSRFELSLSICIYVCMYVCYHHLLLMEDCHCKSIANL